MRTLIAGVGYPFLRDGSLGPVLAARLQRETWPPHVTIDDYSFGPIAVVHRWQAMEDEPFEKVVFFASVERGRPPGTVTRYLWQPTDIDAFAVQERVAEAVTGVISLDNLLIVTHALHVLPRRVIVVEVEPADLGWGEGFSGIVDAAIPALLSYLRAETDDVPVGA